MSPCMYIEWIFYVFKASRTRSSNYFATKKCILAIFLNSSFSLSHKCKIKSPHTLGKSVEFPIFLCLPIEVFTMDSKGEKLSRKVNLQNHQLASRTPHTLLVFSLVRVVVHKVRWTFRFTLHDIKNFYDNSWRKLSLRQFILSQKQVVKKPLSPTIHAYLGLTFVRLNLISCP